MTNQLNVFFSSDKRFVQHFTVTLTSLLENNKDLNLKIHLIHNIEDLSILEPTIKFIRNTYGTEINLISVAHFDFSNYRTTDYYSATTYYRLLIPIIVPQDIDKALYLDSDTIITGSIKELANMDVSNEYVYAVSELDIPYNVNRLNKLGYSLKTYFNAGVLLINLKRWREETVYKQLIVIANKNMEHCEWFDQDILNMHFSDNWVGLDKTYNAIFVTKTWETVPKIIHFNSISKPWYYVDIHPYKYLYWQYLKLTPFKKSRPVGISLKNFVLKNGRLVKRRLRKAGVIK